MQCVLREKLLVQAAKLADVSNLYRTESYQFVDAYFSWLEDAEKDLSALKSPISILLQSEKSSLTAVLDGYIPTNIQVGKNARKTQRAAAARSLETISREIYARIETIDQTLDQLNDKLCQAIAVLASKEPDFYATIQANQQGIDAVWKKLSQTPETTPMYNYLCAKLTLTDRNYLLQDIIQRVVSNKTNGT